MQVHQTQAQETRESSARQRSTFSLDLGKPFSRREVFSASAYALALVWLNAYVCREFFFNETAWMNSMHGFWIALAERAGGSWFHESWWPYWDGGIPFEFTYAPLVPALTALWAAVRGVSHALAFNVISGAVYCLGPVTLFLMVWLLTRLPGTSFGAALFYSFTTPTELLVPDGTFGWAKFWDVRRLFLVGVWDETPHLTMLVLLPLAILFLSLAIRARRFAYIAASVIAISLASLASAFGPIVIAMAALCLLFVLRREDWARNLLLVAGIGAFAWAICASYYPPGLIRSIVTATGTHGEGQWDAGSITTLAMVAFGWAILWRYLRRWTSEWPLQFFALFAYLICSIPILAAYLHHQFLPQPHRYKMEMELALAPVVVFGARHWIEKMPASWKVTVILLFLALAGEQVAAERTFAKGVLQHKDMTQTIEYRTSMWAAQNLRGVRVMLPGSIAAWANSFTGVQQFGGGSWSMAANLAQVRGLYAIYNGGVPDFNETPQHDAATALVWLKAFGVGAVTVSGPKSQEHYKPFAHPSKFEGLLPVLWSSDDVTVYRVPLRTPSLAHVLPESALVTRLPSAPGDVAPMDRYVAALDDPSLPLAGLEWEGTDKIRISTAASHDQILSVQVSYSPGWHATAGGQSREIKKDGLGLMWLRPECSGPCDVELTYNGGWELRLARWISAIATAALVLSLAFRGRIALIGPARKHISA